MKTAFWMVTLSLLLASGCESSSDAAEGEVKTSAKATTRLYVRTHPPGAKIRLDGQPRPETSPQLFEVPAGVKRMTVEVELEGHGKKNRVVEIVGGRIIRVEFDFADGRETPAEAGPPTQPSVGAGSKLIWERVMNPPEGWTIEKSFIVPPDQTAAIGKKLGGPIKRLSNTIYSAHGQRVQVNVIECWTNADAEEIHKSILAMKGDPAYALEFGDTVVEFVGTFDVAFAKRAAKELFSPREVRKPQSVSFAPVTEQFLADPDGAVAELLDLDTGRRATMKEFGRNDRQTHAWIREHRMDAMGLREVGGAAVMLFDVAVWENPSLDWERITATEIRDHQALAQTEPKSITILGEEDLSKLPCTCIFRTREGGLGVLQLVGVKGSRFVQIRYRLVQQKGPSAADRAVPLPPHYVRLVVGKDRMTFEGKETTWDELPGLLQKVPDRAHTVLEVAIPSDEVTLQHKNNAVGRAGRLSRQFGFQHLSFIGVHPLGSKGSESHRVPEGGSSPAAGAAARPPGQKTWTCSMHPQIKLPKPGKCPICAMDLIASAPSAHSQQAQAQIGLIEDALALYQLHVGSYPTTGQNLKALREKPADLAEAAKWRGPYLKGGVPSDPWGRPYRYQSPRRGGRGRFSVWSAGPDGVDGTPDDIANGEPKSSPPAQQPRR